MKFKISNRFIYYVCLLSHGDNTMTTLKTTQENGIVIENGEVTNQEEIKYVYVMDKKVNDLWIYTEDGEIDNVDIAFVNVPNIKNLKITSKTRILKKTNTKVRTITVDLGNGKKIKIKVFEK